MLKRLFFLGASFCLSSAAQSAMVCDYKYTDFWCTMQCENQFIICKSVSYVASVCQNAYNACVASCVRCGTFGVKQTIGSAMTEPTFGEKILGRQVSKAD